MKNHKGVYTLGTAPNFYIQTLRWALKEYTPHQIDQDVKKLAKQLQKRQYQQQLSDVLYGLL